MALDTASLRALFPSLMSGIAHFDGPGGTQTPLPVAEAITRVLVGPLSNRGRATASERNADDAVVAFREAVADLTGGDPRGRRVRPERHAARLRLRPAPRPALDRRG